jgi:DNA-binding transcriptional MerR regulator
MNSAEAMSRSGATYRQLDYWTRQGLLKPVGGTGSGSVRDWSRVEVDVMARMVALVECGLSPRQAEAIARMRPGQEMTLYGNIRICVVDEGDEA